MGIYKGFFKEFFVTKCRICGKKYLTSTTPINAKVCPKCCDELSKEMEEDNNEYYETIRNFYNSEANISEVTEFMLVSLIAMSIKHSVIIFIFSNLANIALKIFLLWFEERKYSD